jgi:hypothetical protein
MQLASDPFFTSCLELQVIIALLGLSGTRHRASERAQPPTPRDSSSARPAAIPVRRRFANPAPFRQPAPTSRLPKPKQTREKTHTREMLRLLTQPHCGAYAPRVARR